MNELYSEAKTNKIVNQVIPTVLDDEKRAFDLFSAHLKCRNIMFSAQVNDQTADIVTSALWYLDSVNHEPINLYINSPGGSVSAGFAIIDVMELIHSEVNVIVQGMAASMGAMILACATGKRFVTKNAEVMIHQPLGGAQGQATEILIAAEHIKKTRDKLYTILAEKTGKTFEQISKDAERDNYMSAEEAVAYGIADEIATKRKKEDK